MESIRCQLCGLREKKQILVTVHPSLGTLSYVSCQKCGIIFMDPRPSEEQMRAIYADSYYAYSDSGTTAYQLLKWRFILLVASMHFGYSHANESPQVRNGFLPNIVKTLTSPFRNKLPKIPPYIPGGRILDVGCGSGEYLELMANLGWNVLGTDISEAAVSAARVKRLPVMIGNLSDLNLPDEHYDVITLWDVLEHLHTPIETLSKVWRLLKPEGLLMIGLPNIDSLQFRIFTDKWHGLHPPYHLSFFTLSTLRMALQNTGFQVECFSKYTSPHGMASSIRNMISTRYTFSIDRLYELTQKFDMLLLPTTLILDMASEGDNLIVWARKMPIGYAARD